MKRIVFCDFDGTITVTETFVAMLKQFAPEISAQLLPEIYAQRLTLKAGVRQMLESISQERYYAIAIGDSITDWNMALAADLVFARPPLTQYLDEQQKPYISWQDFWDIRDHLTIQ